ncbi:hypothetical protein DH09_09215 [Bacillaceae bacterium JMAK1]|nr:hypothetical protein DH09_09215 [Bacillaceae bacterium JMAK1]
MGKKAHWMLLAMIFAMGMLLAACNGGDDGVDTDADGGTDPDSEEVEDDGGEDTGEDDGDTADAGDPVEGGSIILGLDGEIPNLLPAHVNTTQVRDVEDILHAKLYRQQADELELEPYVAEDFPEISEDGLEYVIQLRDDVYFHDGEQVTAEDVAFTVGIWLMDDYGGQTPGLFDSIDTIEATDELELTITLSEPDANMTFYLDTPIVPEHILGEYETYDELIESDYAQSDAVIGAGPYSLDEWVHGQYLTFAANDEYFGEGPYIEEITYRIAGSPDAVLAMVQSGEVDVANIRPQDVSTAETIDGYTISEVEGVNVNFMGFNHENELFQDVRVRQAIAMATDRQGIVDGIMDGHGLVSHIPHVSGGPFDGGNNTEHPYDTDAALELLAEAGWEQDGSGQLVNEDGENFSFSLITNSEAHVRGEWIVAVQDMLNQLGMNVEAETMEFNAYLERYYDGDFDMNAGAWSLGLYADPEFTYHSEMIYPEGGNMFRYADDDFDALTKDMSQIVDPDEYTQVVQDAHAFISEELPVIPMYNTLEHQAYSDRIQGYQHHSRAGLHRPEEWWVNE